MKRKTVMLSLAALFASVLMLQGCTADYSLAVAGKTYVYMIEPESGLESDRFKISLNGDGTFTYHESLISSYLGIGDWSVEEDVLTLTDDYFGLKNLFRIDGGDLIFIEEGSTNFLSVKVSDGERFTSDIDTDEPFFIVQ